MRDIPGMYAGQSELPNSRKTKPMIRATRQRKKAPQRKTLLFIRGISQDLKDKFKAWCALRGVSMTEKIESMMMETVRKGEHLEVRRPTKRS